MNTEQLTVLKRYFGYDQFRDGQAEIIQSILKQQDVLAIMPTGAGKSICYQVPAMLLEGVTLVISPLISLMKDQVTALVQAGIPAAYLNSSQSLLERQNVLSDLQNESIKLLYVAPEQLLTEHFMAISNAIKISFISIDEAHCVSQWGHDFRPGYLKVHEYIEMLKQRPIIGAFTATATEQVKSDIKYLLELVNPFELTTGFDRPNLFFAVKKPKDKFATLKQYVKQHHQKSGIIYCATRKEVEMIHHKLAALDYAVTKYHAGLSSEERNVNQEAFVTDEKPIIVATNAFGMGIDKSNVNYVIHYNMPKNIENYYQEAGRAGRDGTPAECLLLYGGKDVRTHQFFIENTEENESVDIDIVTAFKEVEHERLKQMTFYCYTQDCLRHFILDYFGEKSPEYCGNCSNCLQNFEKKDITIEAQKILSCVKRMQENFGVVMVVDVLRGRRKARLLELGFDQLPTYGILSEYSKKQIRHIIQVLLTEQFLLMTTGQYPVLQLGSRARSLLLGEEKIAMNLPKDEEEPVTKKKAKAQEASANPELFAKLQQLRRELATKQQVPAYIIFSNATLESMCQYMPQTLAEMAQINGVGKVKLEQYGESFLELITQNIS